jgi:nicotinate-nucleotide pyrophosphorylase (carboxylating)
MADLSAELCSRLVSAGLDPATVIRVIRAGLAEDLADGPDVTTAATIPQGISGTADVVSRAPGVIAGLSVAEAVFQLVGAGDGSAESVQRPAAPTARSGLPSEPGPGLQITSVHNIDDGAIVDAGTTLMTVAGPLAAILTAERTALNLITHLSGIATLTRKWVDAVSGTSARIRDTRKTLPGLRMLEKYAVRCGGGVNHRMSLSDAALIKDNHVAAAGSVTAALDAVGKLAPDLPVEVECDTLEQVAEAIAAGAGLILLDNFSVPELRQAVELSAGRARLEASGGLRLADATAVAATGVDYLAVGALTHSAPVLDIGLDLVRAGWVR